LPFFADIDGADAGFDPRDHLTVDVRLGDWGAIKSLGGNIPLIADIIVNHISRESPQFQDYLENGAQSKYRDLFLTLDRVFPEGVSEAELHKIKRPRPGRPFTTIDFPDGRKREFWCTFTSNQLDIDVECPEGRQYLISIFDKFHQVGITTVRLDAVGYAIKRPGTSCFMIPETYAFIDELVLLARERNIEVLVEVHGHYQTQIELARRVDYVYDFSLPALVLHTLFASNARALKAWLKIAPRNCVNVLDTHDGIGIVDVGPTEELDGLLALDEINTLVETIHRNSNGESRQATGSNANNVDLYQINCTFYAALAGNNLKYLVARAIQFFSPGIPQVYYVGLLAGKNDMNLLHKTEVGRDINRHYYTKAEIRSAMSVPVVRGLCRLIALRNAHPAFNGEWSIVDDADHELHMRWTNVTDFIELQLRLDPLNATITYSSSGRTKTIDLADLAQSA